MRRALRFARSLAFLLLVLPAVGASDAGDVTATAAVQVTANPSPVRAHSSPQIAVSPTTGALALVEANVRGDKACAVHISTDDGRTWFQGGDPMSDPFRDCTLDGEWGPYATAAFGRDGVLYVAFVASERVFPEPELVSRHVFVARSENGGRTFATTMAYEASGDDPILATNKGAMLAVDPADPERVYVGWRQGVFGGEGKLHSMVAASVDGGRTFGPPIDLSDERGGDFPSLAVDGDGVLHAVYWTRVFPPVESGEEDPVRPIYYLQSTDQGRSFSDRVPISPGNQDHERPPLIAADPNSSRIYVVWGGNAEPRNGAPDFEGDLDIFMARSTDGGASWSDATVLNDDIDSRADQSAPGIAIAPDGRVDVAWYDDRLNPAVPAAGLQDVFATWSTNGGETFAPNLRITDRSIDRTIGIWENNIGSHHNVGIASTSGAAYMAWQDTRNADPVAQPEDIYTAKVAFADAGSVTEGGASRLLWSVVGASVALALGGLVLLIGIRRTGLTPLAQRARVDTSTATRES